MANDIISGLTSSAASGAATGTQLTSKNKNEQIGKDEFLKLLVTQLKNQDPEAPMDSKEFAVQLAQFTQVEKLISIDDKLTAQSDAANLSSLAGYLGHSVVLNSSAVQVQSGQGGQLQLQMPQASSNVTVQLVNSVGAVVGEKQLGPVGAGKQLVSLTDLAVADGAYSVKVVAQNQSGGGSFQPTVSAAGLVSGFIPGPTPKLLLGSREISISDVKEVSVVNPVG
jgi:flagellar basal-body rod modification protein FlgD